MVYLPFNTYYRHEEGMSDSESSDETGLLFDRQGIITDFVDGSADGDDVLDLLEAQGFDPTEYVQMVEHNVRFLTGMP